MTDTARHRHDPSGLVDRAGHQGGGHRPAAGRRRRPEGRQRPSRHRDEPGAAGLPAVPADHAPRPDRPELGRPRPVRPVQRPLLAHPVHASCSCPATAWSWPTSKALRTWGSLTPGPPRARPHPRRRDHHRPARPGRRQRRRHGDGRPPRARPVRPGRRARRVAVRPPHLRHRRRRLPGGGRVQRGVSAWPGTSSSATSSCSTTTTTSPSRTTPTSPSPRTSLKRYEAYGWHTQYVESGEDVVALEAAIARPRPRPTGRRSSPCAPSSAGRRRPSRTPARPTVRPSARTRSARPRRSSASTRTSTSPSPATSWPTPGGRRPGPQAHARVAAGFDAWAERQPDRKPSCSTGSTTGGCPTAGPTRCRPSDRRRTASRTSVATRAASGKILERAGRRCCPSCGVARPTWPRATTRPWRASPASCRPTARPRCGPAARTGGRCTSASASTPWARS